MLGRRPDNAAFTFMAEDDTVDSGTFMPPFPALEYQRSRGGEG
jgi:hypothetical protein